ncbi:MAG: helix-hairpin-helix domain-containing protein [Candidatus Zixiibacteriota bacterium]
MIFFTRQERLVLIFLVAALVVGATVKIVRGKKAPPEPKALEVEFDLTRPKKAVPASALADATHIINVNEADAEELCTLPGVGPCYAERIVAYREEHGPFERPEDLAAVRGIGPATVEKLRPHITCETPPR